MRKHWSKYGECFFLFFSILLLFLFLSNKFFFSEVWGLGDYCRLKSKELRDRGLLGRFQITPEILNKDNTDNGVCHKRKIHEEEDVFLMRCAFLRNIYVTDSELPKTRLLKWTKENRKKMPIYSTRQENKLFCSIVTVDGRKYGSSFW